MSFCEGDGSNDDDDDDSDVSNREPLRRTRSATHSLPSDSPSARTLALRRLKDAKAKRQLSYGGDEGAGKKARFESSSNGETWERFNCKVFRLIFCSKTD